MKISSVLSENDLLNILKEFHDYFEDGFAFERFLKKYLTKIGFDEVQKTRDHSDGGIDLTAIKKTFDDFKDSDSVKYVIQAKRFDVNNKITGKNIRDFRGTIMSGEKGIYITTSFYNSGALDEAKKDSSRQIVLIDGFDLITNCIDNQIGFTFIPKFSKDELDSFWKDEIDNIEKENENISTEFVEKKITINDIRAKIISLPSYIYKNINESLSDYNVIVNENDKYKFHYNKSRKYFSSVTSFFRKYEILSNDNVPTEKVVKWYYDKENDVIKLFIG